MPPVLFPASSLISLLNLNGDKGARDILRQAQYYHADKDWFRDIDDQDNLQSLNFS